MSELPDPGAEEARKLSDATDDDDADGYTDELAAEVIAAAEAIVAGGPTIETHPEFVDTRTERQKQAEATLNNIWQVADAMAQRVVPQSRLMYSGATVHGDMRRTVDYYQGPRGEPQLFMADYRPGTQNRTVYPCQIMAVRPVKGTPGDHEIVFMNPSVYDDKRRPVPCILRVATQQRRALNEGNTREALLLNHKRTELHALATDGTWHGLLTEKERKRDLELIEARDALMALGVKPPYRAGALNIGDPNVGPEAA